MRIELANLEERRTSFSHLYQPAELDLTDERVSISNPVSVVGELTRTSGGLHIEGKIETEVRVECDRCLKPLTFPISAEFALEYISEQDYRESNAAELTEKQMTVSVFDGEIIDIDEMVREQILLAVPARVLCASGCKGICPSCGANLNLQECSCQTKETDPRWAELKKLKTS
jgi:uncharacterized protein